MTRDKGGPTVNRGGAGKPTADEEAAAFDIGGNVAKKGQEPSPSGRERGETSDADAAAPLDLEDAHDRAS
ncbi:MAG TPA: hypothetical protein VFW19_02775 [Allosphingosinicella sp.]|nr:hypothetical protein [Allosphingosinicella sp.]